MKLHQLKSVKTPAIFNEGGTLIRISLAIVFIWFGMQQLQHPLLFVGWIPKEAGFISLPAWELIMLNGTLEVSLGTLMLFGIFTRISALILGLHLALITLSIGISEIGIRDFGLTMATLGLAGMKSDKFSVENWLVQRFKKTQNEQQTTENT